MGTFTGNTVASGNVIYASDHNTLVSLISAVLNGGIDSTNLADSAVTTAKITDAAVTPAKLIAGTGSTWDFSNYASPTFTNLSVGNGTLTYKYLQTGKDVECVINLIFGSTTSISGDVTVTIPVTSITYPGAVNITPLGTVGLFDTSAGRNYIGHIAWTTTGTVKIVSNAADTAYLYGFVLSSTAPFTWTTGDQISAVFRYKAA